MTPVQMRMARAATQTKLVTLSALMQVSMAALSNYQRGDESALNVETHNRIEQYFIELGITFKGKTSITVASNE